MEDINLSQTPTFSENYTINEQSDFGFKHISYINGQFYYTVNNKINKWKGSSVNVHNAEQETSQVHGDSNGHHQNTLGIKATVLSPSVLEVNTSPSKSTLSLVGVSHSITAATPTCR